jgi:hypothetical protein
MSVPDPQVAIYTAVGSNVVHWAFVEELISDCVNLIYHKYGGDNTAYCKKSGIPRTQFGRKLDFLTEAFETLPSLIQYRDKGLSFMSIAKELSEDRDTIIHGVITNIRPNSLNLVRQYYDKAARKENKPKLKYKEYSLIDLNNLGNKILALVNDLGPFALNLVRDLGH